MTAKFFSAILIYSHDAKRLFNFYKGVLGLPLEPEDHGEAQAHYGCEIGDLHFAIHPVTEGIRAGTGAVHLGLEVFDIERQMKEMAEKNVKIVSEISDWGFMKHASIEDPDGNTIEFSEVSKNWVNHLRNRRNEGHDLIAHWDSLHR